MKKALVVSGGWEGHEPIQVGEILAGILREERFDVEISHTLDSYIDVEKLKENDLIVPIWTMGTITREQVTGLLAAVKSGVGIAGCHGGMADSFREETEYQFMVGGQWVAHPGDGGVTYEVNILDRAHPLTKDMADFSVTSEQYYMHVDPAIKVHATTNFGDVVMPVVWTKSWGEGKVYYNTLGHDARVVALPEMVELMRRGMVWASR